MKLTYSPTTLSRSGQVINTTDLLEGEECYCRSRNPSYGYVWWTIKADKWYMKYPSKPEYSLYHPVTIKPNREVTIA